MARAVRGLSIQGGLAARPDHQGVGGGPSASARAADGPVRFAGCGSRHRPVRCARQGVRLSP